MSPNIAPPAPPPLQPVTAGQNPYDFITSTPVASKKGLIPGGKSKQSRIIIVVIGVVVLLLITVVIASLLSSGSAALKADYESLGQQQTELIRISTIGVSKAHQAEAKNLAVTTQFSVTSQQQTTLKFAKKAGASTSLASLALGKDVRTDALLTTAEQNNQFDSVFIKTVQNKLKTYEQTLKKLYDQSSNKTTQDTLSKDFSDAQNLAGS